MAKQTKLLVAELRVIADTLLSQYCKECLLEAAQRLEDTNKIAEYYRQKAESAQLDPDALHTFVNRMKKYYSTLTGNTNSTLVAYHVDQIAKEVLGNE